MLITSMPIAMAIRISPQPNNPERLSPAALMFGICQNSNTRNTATSISWRMGVEITKWKNPPARDFSGFLLGFLLVLGLLTKVAFFLAMRHPMGLYTSRLYLHHKGKNHGTALCLLIIIFFQRIPDLGIDETPLGRAVTTMVEGFSQQVTTLIYH